MKLLENWKSILSKAWSIRFIILAGVFAGGEVALQIAQPLLETKWPVGLFAAVSGLASAAALVARVFAQNGLTPEPAPVPVAPKSNSRQEQLMGDAGGSDE